MVAARRRDEYFPVHYMEPLAGNEAALGFDLGSNPIRRKALRQAWESGKPVASAPITLVQESGSQSGILLFYPIYENGKPTDTRKQRLDNLQGFVLGVYRAEDLIRASIAHLSPRGVDFLVKDMDAPDGATHIYRHSSRKLSKNMEQQFFWQDDWDGHSWTDQFEIAGREWTFEARLNQFVRENQDYYGLTPLMVFVCGLLMTGLLVAQLIRLRENIIERNAAVQNLQESESRFRSIAHSAPDAIIAADANGDITFWNRGASAIFGHEVHEVMGKPLTMLIPQRFQEAHNQGIARVNATGISQVTHKILDLVGVRKDGSEFPLEASFSTWTANDSRYFASMIRDVSERRKAQKHTENLQNARDTISDLLRLSLQTMDMAATLNKALLLLMNASWLSFQNKGAVFLTGDNGDRLQLAAHVGLPDKLVEKCATVPLGHCLCGRAGQEQQMVFADTLDHRHDIIYHDVKPHGHYAIPILAEERLLGVLTIYLDEGHVSTADERSFLTTYVNTMAGIIQRNRAEEERLVNELASQAKSDFLANMSHEIRTPLNAVTGLTALALQADPTPKIHDYLTKIDNASISLLRIINDILDFSKIEAGKLDLELNEFLIRDLIDHISDLFRAQADAKGVELVTSLTTECFHVLIGDALRLEQILMNLVGNALKFTDEGEVEIAVKTLSSTKERVEMEFMVADTGIGMTGDQVTELFAPFVQADISASRRFGGTGLGLAICKSLTQMMGGRIWVDSAPHKGSTFKFTVVLERARHHAAKQLAPPDDMQRLRVLAVDDNPTTRKALKGMLELFSFGATTVASGPEAVTAVLSASAAGTPYQLLLVDWLMPDMDGLATVRAINDALTETQGALAPKIILLTNQSQEDLIKAHLEADFIAAYISKPVNCSLLFDTVMEVFGKDVTKVYQPGRQHIDLSLIMERLGGARILLVEDNAINRQVAVEILQAAGIVVETAVNGQDAIYKAASTPLDAILMDIQMPEMDGYTATRHIRAIASCAATPIIGLTAHALKGDREKCLAAGMNDHVAKPINKKLLFAALTRWIPQPERKTMPPATTLQPEGENIELPDQVPGIDLSSALIRLNGNRRLLRSLLLEFAADFHASAEKIADAVKQNRPDKVKWATDQVHSIKGMAGNLAADKLFQDALSLETALRGGKQAIWPELLAAFNSELQRVMDSIATLPRTADGENAPSADATMDVQAVKPLLMELAAYIDDSDAMALTRIEDLKPLLVGEDIAGERKRLIDCLDKIDFSGARQALDAIVATLGISSER